MSGVEGDMKTTSRIAAVLMATALTATLAAQSAKVTGTVTYRERMAMPPSAMVEVTLEDVSRADVAAPVIARTRIERPGQVPVAFSLEYDPKLISATRRYAVRARIIDGPVVLFSSTSTTLVLTQGQSSTANLVLTRTKSPLPPPPAPPAPPLAANQLTNLPATFTGTLPCADCQGIKYHLNLFGDDSFFLRRTYVGKPGEPIDDVGSWALSSDRRMIVLMGRGEPEWFALPAAGTLRKLDVLGRPIESKAALELRRASMLQPLDVRLPLRGTYINMADAATFLECSTGQRFPVAMEGANRELESSYSKMRPSPGAATMVEVEGRLAARRRMEGAGTQTTLVVDKVVRWLPKERCLPRFASAPLGDTQWRLTHLGGTAVPAASDPRREPSIVFDMASQTFSGTTGCNRLVGQVTIDQASMTLVAAGTLMACRDEAKAEAAMVGALKATRSYRITGRVLELIDEKGATVARFEARSPSGITVK
jgi:copper homeostasis protein (lipoprotein)